jgi:hypothetical protein
MELAGNRKLRGHSCDINFVNRQAATEHETVLCVGLHAPSWKYFWRKFENIFDAKFKIFFTQIENILTQIWKYFWRKFENILTQIWNILTQNWTYFWRKNWKYFWRKLKIFLTQIENILTQIWTFLTQIENIFNVKNLYLALVIFEVSHQLDFCCSFVGFDTKWCGR